MRSRPSMPALVIGVPSKFSSRSAAQCRRLVTLVRGTVAQVQLLQRDDLLQAGDALVRHHSGAQGELSEGAAASQSAYIIDWIATQVRTSSAGISARSDRRAVHVPVAEVQLSQNRTAEEAWQLLLHRPSGVCSSKVSDATAQGSALRCPPSLALRLSRRKGTSLTLAVNAASRGHCCRTDQSSAGMH
jgi:hypothetical protein